MKVEDKIVCKKDIKLEHPSGFFKKGETYTIVRIEKNNILINNIVSNFWFELGRNFRYIYDYFYTEKELRRLKLEEIERIR